MSYPMMIMMSHPGNANGWMVRIVSVLSIRIHMKSQSVLPWSEYGKRRNMFIFFLCGSRCGAMTVVGLSPYPWARKSETCPVRPSLFTTQHFRLGPVSVSCNPCVRWGCLGGSWCFPFCWSVFTGHHFFWLEMCRFHAMWWYGNVKINLEWHDVG